MEHKLRKIYFTIVIVLAILAGVAAIVFAAGFDVKTTAADAGIHTFFGIAYWTCVIFAAIAILVVVYDMFSGLVRRFIK